MKYPAQPGSLRARDFHQAEVSVPSQDAIHRSIVLSADKLLLSARMYLANEAETTDRDVEHKQRVDRDAHPVPDNSRAAQDTYTSCQRPRDQHQINGYPSNGRKTQCAEKGRNDEREQGVANNADRLEEGAIPKSVTMINPKG